MALQDFFGRPLHDLRISVTDRCNFRCGYCMPADQRYHFLARKEVLTFEEIRDVTQIFVDVGVTKLRLTGGEPLLRRDLPKLVAMLAALKGVEDLAMTTNGQTLANQVAALRDAGLKRVTVSLDSLEPARFSSMSGGRGRLDRVLAGISASAAAGLKVKLNCVVQRGVNDDELVALARFARDEGHGLRFIEFMDVGNINGWQQDKVVPAKEILQRVLEHFPLEAVASNPNATAKTYRYLDGNGELGVIASVSNPFCGGCVRARLSADGSLFTCLFASSGVDLKSILRSPLGLAGVRERVMNTWQARRDRYSALRSQEEAESVPQPKAEMYHLGG